MNKHEKKWLILAHTFNMDGRAASQTITDKIPFLMENGVKPVVISAPTGEKDKNFPHYQVLSPAPSGIRFEMRHIIKKKFQNEFTQRLLKGLTAIICLPFYAMEKIALNLDSHWSWFISAAATGIFAVKKYKPELIYSSAGPTSTHIAGFILSKIFKIPWLAEVHDPIVHHWEKPVYQRNSFDLWLEKLIVKNASAVIYFTEKALEYAEKRTGVKNKGYVLRPGANPPKVEVKYKKREKMHFGHFGVLAADRNFLDFMKALSELFKDKPDLREKICLDVYGAELDSVSRKALDEYSLTDVIIQHGRLEFDPQTGKSGRQRAVENMYLSDVLLLLHGETAAMQEYIPSKTYEYMLTQRPILAITPKDCELAKILTEYGHTIVDKNDDEGLKRVIAGFTEQWEKDGIVEHKQETLFTIGAAVDKVLEIAERCTTK